MLRAAGDESMRLAIPVEANAVVASCVVLVPALAVGAAGVPVNVGDAVVDFRSTVAYRSALLRARVMLSPVLLLLRLILELLLPYKA